MIHSGLLASNRKPLAGRAARNKINRFNIRRVYLPYVAVDRDTGKTMRKHLSCVLVNLAHPRNLVPLATPRQLKAAYA